jgi:hypothetical protein
MGKLGEDPRQKIKIAYPEITMGGRFAHHGITITSYSQ